MRQYIHSKTPRLRWTSNLHQSFLNAICCLGGENKVTPKLIKEAMDIKGLRISHVKSHLQMYRKMKQQENCQESKQGNYDLDKFEIKRKRSRRKAGNAPLSNLEQKFKNNSLLYSRKRLTACEVQSSLIDWQHATSREQSTSYGDYINCSNSISVPSNSSTQQVCYQNDQVRMGKNLKLDLVENGMDHMFEFIYRPWHCTQNKGEQERHIPSELQLQDSLCHNYEKFSSSCTSNQNSKRVLEQDEISYNTSNDSQAVLVSNSNQFDNFWKAESKELDGFPFGKKPLLREADVRLELSLSISS